MLRKILCSLLVIVVAMGLLAVCVYADETEPTVDVTEPTDATIPTEPEQEEPEQTPGLMTTSDEAVRMLKAEEGFSAKPYWDYAQWTVGYGTKCPDDMLDYYKQYGISEAEAEQLLRNFLLKFETELHKFMERTSVELNQNQFDALLLFTYNCGSGWTYDTGGTFYNAIVNGKTGNDLVYAFSRWCNAGGKVMTVLLRRRLCEANIYLNGVYSQSIPAEFGYVLYDACGGTASPSVQGFEVAANPKILSTASREGYIFLGWYTAETGGTKVERLGSSVRNSRLYAHWEPIEKEPDPSALTVTVTSTDLNIRSGPGTDYVVVTYAVKGDQFVITETAEGNGYTWGKSEKGWLCLDYTDYTPETTPEQQPEPPTEPAEPEFTPRMGTVKVSDCLRVRSGPSTGYDVVAYLNNGDRVEILEEQIIGTMVWGRTSQGWLSLDYLVLDQPEEPEPPQQTEQPEEPKQEPIATGTVKVDALLRVRSGPGISYAQVDYLANGTKVSILETKDSEGMTWGKIDKGWISLDYVALDKKEEEKPKTVTGTVKVDDFLRVRAGTGTSYAIAGYLANGTKVEILEQKKVGLITWGRIDSGWISLDYVVLDVKVEEPAKVIKTVTADCLRVRIEPGTGYTIVGYLYEGAKVEILETKKVNGTLWGRIANGWISMDYVK